MARDISHEVLLAQLQEYTAISSELRTRVPDSLLGYIDSFRIEANVNADKEGKIPAGQTPESHLIVTFKMQNKIMSVASTMLRESVKNKAKIPNYLKHLEQRLDSALDIMEYACGFYRGLAEKALSALSLAEDADTPEKAEEARKAKEDAKEALKKAFETTTAGKDILNRFRSMQEAVEEKSVDVAVGLLKKDAKLAEDLGIDSVLKK